MIQRPRVTSSGLNEKDHDLLVKELTKYAQEGASDDDLMAFKKEFVAQKKKSIQKKEVSEPISASKPSASNIQAQEQSTSSDTENQSQTSGLVSSNGNQYRLAGSKQPKLPETETSNYDLQQNKAVDKQMSKTAKKPISTPQQRLENVQIANQTATPARDIVEQTITPQQVVEDAKNKIFSVNQDKLDQAVNDEESKNEGFWGTLKQGATDVLNSVSNGMNKLGLIDESANLKLPIPYEDYLKGIDKSLPQEQRLAMAKDLFIKDKAKQQIEDNAKNLLSIIVTSANSGILEYIPNTISLDSLKNKIGNGTKTLYQIYTNIFEDYFEEA